jgi:ankyrin repeat protein
VELEACRQSLYITDPYIDREVLISTKGKRVPGTCEWIAQHASYQSWLSGTSSSSLLWICGGPGKGKTIMSIFLTEELERITPGNVLYGFCSAQDERRNSVEATLRSLACQLLTRMPSLIRHTRPYFESPERKQQTLLSMQTLWIIFWKMITDADLPPMYCVLDGLDECDEAGLQFLMPKLIEVFSPEALSPSSKGFKLAIVSRPNHIMKGMQRYEQVNLDIDNSEAVNNDIEQFIHAGVEELSGLEGFGHELQEYVQTTLLNLAEGTFLWAGFAMMELRQCTTCTQLLDALERIPLGLSAVYSQIILRIPEEHRDNSFKILKWVVLARRPLSLAELAAATELVKSLAGMHEEQDIRDGIALCGPFLVLEGTSVDLVHVSARDYFLREEADIHPVLEAARIKQEMAHLEMAHVCMECITHSALQAAPCSDLYSEDDHLLEYAIHGLIYHLLRSEQYANELYYSYSSFFLGDSNIRNNWWATIMAHIMAMGIESTSTLFQGTPVLHIASCLGIETWIEAILSQEPQQSEHRKRVKEIDKDGDTALHYALLTGRVELVPLLLRGGVDIDAKNASGDTVLMSSARCGNEDGVVVLIENGANVEKLITLPSGENCNALHEAAYFGREAVVQLLLERGANIHAKTSSGRTALLEAVRGGEQSVAQLLLDKGANLHSRDHKGVTVLMKAVVSGRDLSHSMVRFLLDRGAHINTVDTTGWTALGWAAHFGYTLTVCLLLERGASMGRVPSQLTRAALFIILEDYGSVALCLAARKGHAAIVKLLLEKGADPRSSYGGNAPRTLAVKEGHDAVIKLLDEALLRTGKPRWL